MGRAYNCWILNWWCITWPVGFKWLSSSVSEPAQHEVAIDICQEPVLVATSRDLYKCFLTYFCVWVFVSWTTRYIFTMFLVHIFLFAMVQLPTVGQGLLIVEDSCSHSSTPQSGLLWMSDQFVAETSTLQHSTLTRDQLPCPPRDSNTHSQQASGHRPTP